MTGTIQGKWDPKNYEIKSKSVEKQLQPLIIQVTTLIESDKKLSRKGKSKKASVLVATLEKSIKYFIEKGEEIAEENPQVRNEMRQAIEEIRVAGDEMSTASREFADDPFSSEKRSSMVKSARLLLSSVTRLLILADMIDIQLLLQTVAATQASLEILKTTSTDQITEELTRYNQLTTQLLHQSGQRQHELTNPQLRDDLAAARAILKKTSTMLLSATKAYLKHSNIPAARANRDQILKQICEAVDVINVTAQGESAKKSLKPEEAGKLAMNLDSIETINSINYKEIKTRQTLEQQLDELVSGATLISESGNLKDERREKIITGCNAVREALQSLLTMSMTTTESEKLADDVTKKTKNLRRQLHKAIADKVNENFSNAISPLENLTKAAEKGQIQEVETCAAIFTEHCNKLIEVSNQVCYLSNNEDGIKMVKSAASQLATLCPSVINAARLLAAQPQSETAKENMEIFAQMWKDQMKILLDAVDDITTIDDVLSVLDNQTYDEMNEFVKALQERDVNKIETLSGSIQKRLERICDVVSVEMDNYIPCLYTRNVLEAVKILNNNLEMFKEKTEKVVNCIGKNEELDENEYIDATRLVYDGVRDVRRAVLLNRADDELDPEEVEFEETYATDNIKNVKTTEEMSTDNMSGITVARQAMSQLPEKEKSKILEEVENFKTEKQTFDREVAKWEETDNDIVVLAKHMCLITMQMTDFVRGKGPLKTTTDIINAAKKLSESGKQLDKLGRQIADVCPESTTKKDLLAYLERVTLYCHQINIISKVKADVQHNTDEEMITVGLESAVSLIENAKNLMNAVVLTVKESYIASKKYSRQTNDSPIVIWRMKAPEKKPLVRREKVKEVRAVVRRASQKPQNPIRVLAQFQNV